MMPGASHPCICRGFRRWCNARREARRPYGRGMGGELLDDFAGKLWEKCQIVLGVNDQRFLAAARKLVEINHRADAARKDSASDPDRWGFHALPDVAGRLPVPKDIGEVRRSMIESGDTNTGIVRAGNKRITRAQAGAE